MVVKVKNMEGKLDRESSRSEKGYISPEEFLPFLPPPFVIPQSESPFLLVSPEPRHRRTSGLIKMEGGGEDKGLGGGGFWTGTVRTSREKTESF